MEGVDSQCESVIVIVGGMGPLAGIQCYKYVLENSKTNGTDQGNLDTVVVSYPRRIENRVEFVLGRSEMNPGNCVLEFLLPYLQMLSTTYKKVIVGVPCVTFHCPSIFSVFCEGIESSFPSVLVVSIVKSTVSFINAFYPKITRIGILSTDGTRKLKPFAKEFEESNKQLVYLSDEQQVIVSDCIFNTQWFEFCLFIIYRGVKSPSFDKLVVHSLFCDVMNDLIMEGCEAIILGCTEIPLAIEEKEYKGIPILNPSWILARSLISEVDDSMLSSI